VHSHARRGARIACAFVAISALVLTACTKKEESTTGPRGTGTVVDTAAVLGTPKKATGDPITLGMVYDGKSDGLDQSDVLVAFKATVDYANEYLGGINGHVIKYKECSTNNTPAGGTQCGVQMASEKVAAVLVPVSAQDGSIFTALEGSGIPYVTYQSVNQNILIKPGAFVLTNPVGAIAVPAKLASEAGTKKVASVVIDVPAATGPITALATPMYKKAGVDFSMVPVSPQVADMTPQIQQAISDGGGFFSLAGTDEFNVRAIKAIKQLGFTGPIMIGSGVPAPSIAEAVPGGVEGIIVTSSSTHDVNDADAKLYDAIVKHYAADEKVTTTAAGAYGVVMGFVRALEGVTAAVDAPSITTALSTMPAPVKLPLGGGLTFQCGSKPVAFAPNICAANVLQGKLDKSGVAQDFKVADVQKYLTLG